MTNIGLHAKAMCQGKTLHATLIQPSGQHHAVGLFSPAETGNLFRADGKMNGAKYRAILEEKLLEAGRGLRLGCGFSRTTTLNIQPELQCFLFFSVFQKPHTPG
ncbi:hypothetical protein XENOCAPTIV_026712 [Xenoophorus captivus]|uniref:Uncharacterized protein n=1 Tax=Xenoophorus captivus TaxID=1517983 RepID=A0ABV0RJL1_9TELE